MTRPSRDRKPEFTAALQLANKDPEKPQPLCQDNPAYSCYETHPSKEEAVFMCEPCPLFELCRDNALWERPQWGVMGGIAWQSGRQYHLRRTATDELSEDEDEVVELLEKAA